MIFSSENLSKLDIVPNHYFQNTEDLHMTNRKRNIQFKIWVTEEKRNLIEHKLSFVPTRQIGAYL